MYTPKKFKVEDKEAILRVIKENAFATLSSSLEGKPIATHTPIYYIKDKEEEYLIGHISKQNPQHHCFDGETSCLAIFHGPHCYVSSSWYGITQAPTWNYISIHVTGICSPLPKEKAHQLLSMMVNHYEEGRPGKFSIDQMPPTQLDAMLDQIVAFKMDIETVEATFKLSQNRNDKDYQNIIDQLTGQEDQDAKKIAAEMQRLR